MLNILAGEIGGVGRAARLPVLRATAGILSVRYMYLRQCAGMVDRVLRAGISSICGRVGGLISKAYNIPNWKFHHQFFSYIPLLSRVCRRQLCDADLQEFLRTRPSPTFRCDSEDW